MASRWGAKLGSRLAMIMQLVPELILDRNEAMGLGGGWRLANGLSRA